MKPHIKDNERNRKVAIKAAKRFTFCEGIIYCVFKDRTTQLIEVDKKVIFDAKKHELIFETEADGPEAAKQRMQTLWIPLEKLLGELYDGLNQQGLIDEDDTRKENIMDQVPDTEATRKYLIEMANTQTWCQRITYCVVKFKDTGNLGVKSKQQFNSAQETLIHEAQTED